MSTIREKRTYSQFLDLEAAVSDREDSPSDDESIDGDFIDDMPAVRDRPPLHRNQTDNTDADLERLRAIAQSIESRARRFGYGRPLSPSEFDLGSASDPLYEENIWRVRVKVENQSESDIAFAIRENKERGHLNIVTAFFRAASRGSIYIVAKNPSDVHTALQGIYGIVHNSQGPRIELIPEDERLPLLRLENLDMPPEAAAMSWVRVKREGHYYSRLALVLSADQESSTVLLARRHASNKRRKRPSDSDNLIERRFPISDLSSSFVNPTEAELDEFKRSRHPSAVLALRSWTAPLHMDDRVEVILGPLRGLKGRISFIKDQTVTLQPLLENTSSLDVSLSDVRKLFIQGDFVRVMHGRNEGEEGFIVDIDESYASLYKPGQQGSEVVRRRYIDFADNAGASQGSQTNEESSRVEAKNEMYTGEPYKHMEVQVIRGTSKGTWGRVLGSRVEEEHLQVVVEPFSMSTRYQALSFKAEDVVELRQVIISLLDICLTFFRTKLPIEKARWIPRRFCVPNPPSPPPVRGLTPPPVPEGQEPLFPIQEDEEDVAEPALVAAPVGPIPGEWLLSPKLLGRSLCVHIRGTIKDSFHRGRYENESGKIELEKVPSSTNDSIVVRVGQFENKRSFRIRYLLPDTTFNMRSAREQVHVVAIGPDVFESTELVGFIGVVVDLAAPLGMHYVVFYNTPSSYLFHENSLCRSA